MKNRSESTRETDIQIELMAPAGHYPALSAAIRNGADSIYFGVEGIHMRSMAAKQFTISDIRRVARICRWTGVKSYLTLNTILFENELPLMKQLIVEAEKSGINAIIACDPAVLLELQNHSIPVHLSVQANVCNLQAVRFYAQFADVIVLARELSLEQITEICEGIQREKICGPSGEIIKVEIFIHGALCIAHAGKCYMSLASCNHSASRGECLQPCRRSYRVFDAESGIEMVVDHNTVMSPADLCTMEFLDQIIASGVSILKIEGRARAADYVGIVTRSYRQALDALTTGEWNRGLVDRLVRDMQTVYNRTFWQGGYYQGKTINEWSRSENTSATRKRQHLGVVTNYFVKAGVAEIIIHQEGFNLGDELVFEGPTTGSHRFTPTEIYCNDVPVSSVTQGDLITIKVDTRVRRKDNVFRLDVLDEEGPGIRG